MEFKEEYGRIHAHRVFAASMGTLPYPLVSDWFRELVHQYGMWDERYGCSKRFVVVIDKEGVIRCIGPFTPREPQQVTEPFELLQNLSLLQIN